MTEQGVDVEGQSKLENDTSNSRLTDIPLTSTDTPAEGKSTESENVEPCHKRAWSRWWQFYNKNSFLILVVIVILLAYAYPPLGAVYVYPQITATWIAVIFIFVMAGLGLKTEELSKALQRVVFNSFVQIYNFGIVSSIVYGFSRALSQTNVLTPELADGMTICACLPLTVNMCLVLTKSSGGDEAAAVFNSAFGNMSGVFITPLLILGYLGVEGNVSLGTVFLKLGLRVVLPIAVGQILQKFSKLTVAFVKKYKKHFKKVQEWCLVFIVYTVFCKTFSKESVVAPGSVFLMIALQFVLLVFVMVLSWFLLRIFFRNEPKLRVMGLFGCTHKTVAMGVPLINAIYEDNPNVGLYTLPLLVWHPMQLLIGTAIAPRLSEFVAREEARISGSKLSENGEEQDVEMTVTK